VLADNVLIEYSKGKIRFKTTNVLLRIGNIINTRRLNIIDIRDINIFIEYN
jgi:hypothetical protein